MSTEVEQVKKKEKGRAKMQAGKGSQASAASLSSSPPVEPCCPFDASYCTTRSPLRSPVPARSRRRFYETA